MDKFIVSARKYRPASFSDVVGQASISSTLKNSIKNHHLGHAYLFSGPRGVGKTTCARIFARTINCTAITPEGEACNQCESCQSFNENRSYSIHELDAASNNSVDDIRTLTEQVRIPPQVGTYSIYIIDEVHMLSQAAFNAFLKTLEEPPAHAIFILATTEKHKIIPTILSRCQIFDFNRIKVEDTVNYLKSIAAKEDLKYEDEALHVIALKADGAMRDALSIFDQVVSFSGETIRYQDVINNLNILDYDYYFRLTSYALEGEVPAMLLLFDEVLSRGFDERNFINGYAEHLRDLMVCKDPQTVQLMEVGAGFRDKYLSQSTKVSLPFLYDGLEICNQADIQFRSSRNQRLSIELALVKLGSLTEAQKKKLSQTEPVSAAEEQSSAPPSSSEAREAQKPVQQVHKASISILDSIKGKAPAGEVASSAREPGEAKIGTRAPEHSSGEQVSPEAILEAWRAYTRSVEKSQPRVFSTLKNHLPEITPAGELHLKLNSEAQRDHFIKSIKPGISQYIREKTGLGSLEITTELAREESNHKKIYTDQDKLQYLIKKNPDLARLKNHFNLDFDH